MTHWVTADGQDAASIYDFDYIQEHGYHGFVYIITNLETSRAYIGRKRMTRRLTRPPLKGRKNRRHYVKESDWKSYTGSCKELNAEIEVSGIEGYSFVILSIHKSQREMNYHEMGEHFLRNVLQARMDDGTKAFYNDNISQQFYTSEECHDERMALYERHVKS